jgi:hypothetical protein
LEFEEAAIILPAMDNRDQTTESTNHRVTKPQSKNGKRLLGVSVPLWSIVLWWGCNGAPPPPPYKPVADTKLLMQAVVDPSADELWDAVRTIVDREGTHEIRPKSNEEWTAARNHAVALAESGNLLMMVPRAKDGDEWMKRSRELIDQAERAIKAADAKNADELFTVGGDIYEACSNCHQKYLETIVNANK